MKHYFLSACFLGTFRACGPARAGEYCRGLWPGRFPLLACLVRVFFIFIFFVQANGRVLFLCLILLVQFTHCSEPWNSDDIFPQATRSMAVCVPYPGKL